MPSRAGWARGLAVMTPRLHRVDRGFNSHRAHYLKQRLSVAFTKYNMAITIQGMAVNH